MVVIETYHLIHIPIFSNSETQKEKHECLTSTINYLLPSEDIRRIAFHLSYSPFFYLFIYLMSMNDHVIAASSNCKVVRYRTTIQAGVLALSSV